MRLVYISPGFRSGKTDTNNKQKQGNNLQTVIGFPSRAWRIKLLTTRPTKSNIRDLNLGQKVQKHFTKPK